MSAEPATPGGGPRLFDILTWQGTRVVVDLASGVLYHGQPIPGRFGRLLAWLPDGRADACVLLAAPADPAAPGPLILSGDPDRDAVISFHAVRQDDTGWALRHPVTGLFLCAVRGDDHGGVMVADRSVAGPWERFTLAPAAEVPAALAAMAAEHAALLRRVGSVPGMLAALLGDAEGGRLRPFLRLMWADELDWLGRALRRDPAACARFAQLYPDDPWARLALPALAALPPGAAAAGMLGTIDPSLDRLATAGFDGRFVSVPQVVNARARRDRAPTRGVCLLATVRNEGLYLLEWIAYHQALGVDAFLIYGNDNDDGSDALLHALAVAGVIGWIPNRTGAGVSPQYKAYGHAFQVLPQLLDFRWAGVIDLDEFVVLDRARVASLPDLLSLREAGGADAVALSWVMFGSNGQRVRTDAPLTGRFTSRDVPVNPHVKSFSRPHRFLHAQCHYPVWEEPCGVTILGAAGGAHPTARAGDGSAFAPAPDDSVAWVAHYHTKSAEEFILRRSFSRGDMGLAQGAAGGFFATAVAEMFVAQHAGHGQVQDRRAAACVPDLADRIAALRAVPGVAEAMAAIERSYTDRLAALVNVLATDGRFLRPGSPENWFLLTLTRGGTPDRSPAQAAHEHGRA